MINENDDWEIAVDTGEFDKRIEQQEKDRIALQINLKKSIVNNDDNDNRNSSNINLFKPIRILKRPTSQSQLPVDNSSLIPNSSFSNENSSSITVSNISNIPQNQIKDSINSSQTIKTYEQREQEYRLARLRIMGEEESSAKDDDDDDSTTIDTTSITSDETSNITLPVHSSLQNQINYGNNAVHFTSTGPFSQPQYRTVVYTSPYPSMPLSHYPPAGLYISSSSNPWYEYQQQQTPFETQQYNHPQ